MEVLKIKDKITLQFFFYNSFNEGKDINLFCDLLMQSQKEFIPEYISTWESKKIPFSINALKEIWDYPILCISKTQKIKVEIYKKKDSQSLFSIIVIDITANKVNQLAIIDFFKTIAYNFDTYFACINILNDFEIQKGLVADTVTSMDNKGKNYCFYIASDCIAKKLPGVYWSFILGPTFIIEKQIFNRFKQEIYNIEEKNQMTFYQLSSLITDVYTESYISRNNNYSLQLKNIE